MMPDVAALMSGQVKSRDFSLLSQSDWGGREERVWIKIPPRPYERLFPY